MSIQVRKAVHADMSQVLELIQALAVFENEPDVVEVTVADLEREGFGTDPLFQCFVAEDNGDIVGMALVYFRFSTWKGRTVHLEDLMVRESYRGRGVGVALYKKVLSYAQSQGVKRVEWVVLDWNKNAVHFYEKSGATLLKDWYLVQMDNESIASYLEK